MARRWFYRWNFVFSEETFEESFRDSASRRRRRDGTSDGVTEGRIKRRARGGCAHFKREQTGKWGGVHGAREKRSMGGGKNVHRNLYNEEFHYTGLDIYDTVYLRVRVVHVHVYTHTYIHMYTHTHIHTSQNIERRVSSTEIRSVYICRQPPSRCPLPLPRHSAFSDLCMNHDAPVSSPWWNRFFVSPTFVRSSLRRE